MRPPQICFRCCASAALILLLAGGAAGAEPASPGDVPLLPTMLEGPLAGVEEIVFAVRTSVRRHYYENFGFAPFPRDEYPLPPPGAAGPQEPLFGKGGQLRRLNLRTGELTVLLDDPEGAVRDPQVHYDGRTILFSYRRGGSPYFNLYEIDAGGTLLEQLTDGPFDDIEPAYLPDGGIVFCSSRCRRMVGCFPAPVATLYRLDRDPPRLRMLSPNPFTDNTPWMLPDGRVMFTRWEYVDRNQMSFHHLWTCEPDGTGQMVLFGNQYTKPGQPPPRFFDVAMLDAKPIPGTNKIVAVFSPDHGRWEHMGHVTVIDPRRGPDVMASAQPLNARRTFRDPYPVSEDCFLLADEEGLWVMDGQGQVERIYQLADGPPGATCHEPRPLLPRQPEPQVQRTTPPAAESDRTTGELVLADIYQGRNMEGVARGEIKSLLILEQLPRPVSYSGGSEPLTIGGSFSLERILGTVPVEPDGSAYMQLPAGRPLFVVALDEQGLSVKRMQSFLTVQPGERTSCVGCHEPRQTAPPTRGPLEALNRPPSRIEPIGDVPDVLDYPRDIQPILDRHCAACHSADCREGGVDLSGDCTPMYSASYWTMVTHGLISDGRNYLGNQPPRTVGSSASRLLTLTGGEHYDARLSDVEQRTLRLWIESGATYPGTYAGLGSGISLVTFPTAVLQRRCAECHLVQDPPSYSGKSPGDHYQFGQRGPPQALVDSFQDFNLVIRLAYLKFGEAGPHQSLCNLSRPDKSLLIQAPLSAAADGLGLCQAPPFADSDDPDYQQLLAAIRSAADGLARHKRFHMPGFQPSPYYVRQMQAYGILPEQLDSEPIDPYAADRAYWRLFELTRP